MPRNHIPKYREHAASGQARVTLSGRTFYLGKHGSAASRRKYHELVAQWLRNGRCWPESAEEQSTETTPPPPTPAAGAVVLVADVCAAYLDHFEQRVEARPGKASGDFCSLKQVVRHLRPWFTVPADEFGPKRLKSFRLKLLDARKSRCGINRWCSLVRAMFRWAVGEEMVAGDTYHRLQAVPGLRRGETSAGETDPVRPVSDVDIERTLPHLPTMTAAMVRVQRLTGMRPGEVCRMRTGDLDPSGDVWLYRPSDHKTSYLGHQRVIAIGPRAQAILLPYLRPALDQSIFSPQQSEAQRHQELRARRQSKVTPSQRARGEARQRRQRRRAPGDHYSPDTQYRRSSRSVAGCPSFIEPCQVPERLVLTRIETDGDPGET